MDLRKSLVADSQTVEIMEPSMSTFDYPSILSKSAAMFSAALGEDRFNTAIAQFLSVCFGVVPAVETGVVIDSEGRRTEPLSALICVGGQLIDSDVGPTVVPTETVAAAIDVAYTLDLNGLAAAYSRVSAAKALKKTVPFPGNQTTEPTLGVVFAVDATVPLEDIAAELERLNERTPSDHWPDAVVIATKGQLGYMVQWIGDQSVSGLLLPPSPGVLHKTQPSYYAVLMISASGAGTFDLAMHMLLGQLARWSPGSVSPEYLTVLDCAAPGPRMDRIPVQPCRGTQAGASRAL
jgi:hypothetical protein